jgi:hypothetical protein
MFCFKFLLYWGGVQEYRIWGGGEKKGELE